MEPPMTHDRDAHETIHRSLGRIEGKLDGVVSNQDTYGCRLEAVEKKLWYQTGVFAAIAAVVGYLVNLGGPPP